MITIKYIGYSFIVRDSIAEAKEELKTKSIEAQYWKDNYFTAMSLLQEYMISDIGKVIWKGYEKKGTVTNLVLSSIAENG